MKVSIIGTGKIGTDLLYKLLKIPEYEVVAFVGRRDVIKNIPKNVTYHSNGINFFIDNPKSCDIVFDCTDAYSAKENAKVFRNQGIYTIDLTPSKIGRLCVPNINCDCLYHIDNVNMVTCGGQASIPLACAITAANRSVQYIETTSSIASRSAGPATRINLDEYLLTTETGLGLFTSCVKTKAILNLNPAEPSVHMQTTVMAKILKPDLEATQAKVTEMVNRIKHYVPGYHIILNPIIENDRLITTVGVTGLGDHLPKYAGNLDIINCAAISYAEAYAKRQK